MNDKKIINIDNITFFKTIKFIVPTYLTVFFTTLYTIADGLFVARYVGTNGLAAINIVYPLINILQGIALVFAVGGSAWSAIFLGQGKKDRANIIFSSSTILSVLLGILFALATLTFLTPILDFLGATDITKEYGTVYVSLWLWASPMVILKEIFIYYIRVEGKPELSFFFSAMGGVINIVLDYIFIGIMGMGIWGAGIATIIGIFASALMGGIWILKNAVLLKFDFKVFDFKILPKILINGSSEMINQIAIAVTTVVFNKTALEYAGEDGIAAVSIIMYVQFVFLGVYTGYSAGIAPLLSYSFGHGIKEVTEKLKRYSHLFMSIVPIILYIVAYLGAPWLVAVFSERTSEVYSLGLDGMRLYSIGYLFAGISIFTAARFAAFGQGQYSALITSLRSFILLLLFLILLPRLIGFSGVWLAMPVAEGMTVILTISLNCYFKGKNKRTHANYDKFDIESFLELK